MQTPRARTANVLAAGIAPFLRAAVFLLVAYLLVAKFTPPASDHDGPLHLAARMLRGHLGFDTNTSWWEMFQRGGQFYLVYAPMVSAVLVPYVAAGGLAHGMPLANTLFVLASAAVLWRLLRAVRPLRPWADLASLAYLLGTPLLYSVAVGSVWLLIHSEGNLFLGIALLCAWLRRYGWFGFAYAMAVACRNGLFFAAPFVLVLLWRGQWSRANLQRFAGRGMRFAVGATPPLIAALLLQRGMTGSFLLSTYQETYRQWGVGRLYGTEYFWHDLHVYFAALPRPTPYFPFLAFDQEGCAFWVVSPFLLYLAGVRLRLRFFRALVVGVVCGFAPYLFFVWAGSAQYGTRYVTDLFPFLFPLAFSTVTGRRRRSIPLRGLLYLLVAVSVLLNTVVALLAQRGQLWH